MQVNTPSQSPPTRRRHCPFLPALALAIRATQIPRTGLYANIAVRREKSHVADPLCRSAYHGHFNPSRSLSRCGLAPRVSCSTVIRNPRKCCAHSHRDVNAVALLAQWRVLFDSALPPPSCLLRKASDHDKDLSAHRDRSRGGPLRNGECLRSESALPGLPDRSPQTSFQTSLRRGREGQGAGRKQCQRDRGGWAGTQEEENLELGWLFIS